MTKLRLKKVQKSCSVIQLRSTDSGALPVSIQPQMECPAPSYPASALGEPCRGQSGLAQEPETQPQVWLGRDFDVGLLGSCLVLQATSPILLPTELKDKA